MAFRMKQRFQRTRKRFNSYRSNRRVRRTSRRRRSYKKPFYKKPMVLALLGLLAFLAFKNKEKFTHLFNKKK